MPARRTSATLSTRFVARERELAQLQSFLDHTLAGCGQVCFVTGEAGAGKTALVTEFARRAQAEHDDLVVAIGNCNAQTGIGDPYLPFREILGMLTGDVDRELAQGTITRENASRLQNFLRISGKALVELGPDLIEIFVPVAGLATRAGAFVAGRAGWLDRLETLTERESLDTDLSQSRIFEQYTDVLSAVAEERPLILVVDDLHWADVASINLLFHLGRRIADSRILLVGAYRPADVALGRAGGRHPLTTVVNEFKRYFGDIWVHLGQATRVEGRQFVDALLDTEPNRLSEAFREALYQYTEGHPLFTIELVHHLQERDDLVQDAEGYWIDELTLDWETLPARVEGVIDERIGRLNANLREVLTVASVEGRDFTAQVVARVLDTSERDVVSQLSRELDRKHHLVREQGSRLVGGQRLYRYRFRHSLFQQHLYNELGAIERDLLHADVGAALEELHGEHAEDIAPQLAWHFAEAHENEKAFAYHLLAGDVAWRNYARQEGKQHYQKAKQLLPHVPTPTVEQRMRLYAGLGHAHSGEMAVGHYLSRLSLIETDLNPEDPMTRRLLAQTQRWIAEKYRNVHLDDMGRWLEKAAETLGEPQDVDSTLETVRLLGVQAWLARRRGKYRESLGHSDRALQLLDGIENSRLKMTAYSVRAFALWMLDRWQDALEATRQVQRLNQTVGDKSREYSIQELLGLNYWPLGEYTRALEAFWNMRRVAESLDYKLSYPKLVTGMVCLEAGALTEAENWLTDAVEGFERRGGWFYGWALTFLGAVYHRAGRLLEADTSMREGIEQWHASGVVQLFNLALALRAELDLDLDRVEEAVGTLHESVALSQKMDQPWVEGIAGRLLGRAYRLRGNLYEADRYLVKSIETHERLGSKVEYGRSLYEYGLLHQEMEHTEDARTFLCLFCWVWLMARDWSQALAALEQMLDTVTSSRLNHPLYDGFFLAARSVIEAEQGHLTEAHRYVEEALALMARFSMFVLEPEVRHLLCQALLICDPPAAHQLIDESYHWLIARAAEIPDPELRDRFLHAQPSNWAILDAWRRLRAE